MASKTTSVFKKSEFWVTVVTSVSGLLLAFGVITPTQATTIGQYAPNLIGALLALLSGSKFVSTQSAAKTEVFRAMCAMRMAAAEKTGGEVSAKSLDSVEADVAGIARAAGL